MDIRSPSEIEAQSQGYNFSDILEQMLKNLYQDVLIRRIQRGKNYSEPFEWLRMSE
jgi:hypothetical protein